MNRHKWAPVSQKTEVHEIRREHKLLFSWSKRSIGMAFQVTVSITLQIESVMTFVIPAVHWNSFGPLSDVIISSIRAIRPVRALDFHYHRPGWDRWRCRIARKSISLLTLHLSINHSDASINNICNIVYIDLTKIINGTMRLHVIVLSTLAVCCDFILNMFPFLSPQTQFSYLATALNWKEYPPLFASIPETHLRSDLTFWDHP